MSTTASVDGRAPRGRELAAWRTVEPAGVGMPGLYGQARAREAGPPSTPATPAHPHGHAPAYNPLMLRSEDSFTRIRDRAHSDRTGDAGARRRMPSTHRPEPPNGAHLQGPRIARDA